MRRRAAFRRSRSTSLWRARRRPRSCRRSNGWHWRVARASTRCAIRFRSRRGWQSSAPARRPRRLRGASINRSAAPTAPDYLALARSEEHTSELQSRENLVCRLLLEKKKKKKKNYHHHIKKKK